MFIDLQNKTFYFIPLYKIEISFYFFHKCYIKMIGGR